MQNVIASRAGAALLAAALACTAAMPAFAEDLVLKKDTDIHLLFAGSLNSKTAKPGNTVMFRVETPVKVNGKTVIAEGTHEKATVVKVTKRGRYGTNARIQLKMSPIRSVNGKWVAVGFHTKGQEVGSRTGEAAGATIGGAAVLGPVGLAAGYFIVGKQVNAKPGDKLTVNVDKDISIRVK